VTTQAPEPPDRQLQLAHRASLAILAVCAFWSWGLPDVPGQSDNLQADPRYTVAAFVLGFGAIVCRQRAAASRSARMHFRMSLGRFAFAAALGGLALLVASREGQQQVALLYCLAGAILALRLPGHVAV
jgi:peptidoglycan/LPS O-acetylase OafA/YrhL